MTQIQLVWDKTKKTLKFAWRHFFTLGCLSMAVYAFIFTKPILSRVLITLCVAVLLDWAKQFIKLDRNSPPHFRTVDSHDDITVPIHTRQWWNSEIYGSATNLMETRGIKWDR